MRDCFISIGFIIIDDIILPDGARKLGVLGGGATHAVMGMRVWTDRVGLVSGVGGDHADEILSELDEYFYTKGMKVQSHLPTPRAWQVFDKTGHRDETFQTSQEGMLSLLPEPAELKDYYQHISGVHLHCSPENVQQWVPHLRELGCKIILWEPFDEFCRPENRELFRRNSKMVDIVSPNLREGRMLTGLQEPVEVIQQLVEYGAPAAALRMGGEGSLVASTNGDLFRIPSYPVENLVDVTGAGNAYCGGFIVGLHREGDLQMAGWYGAVSASFTLEQFGVLYDLSKTEDAQNRLAWYEQQAAGNALLRL
jgi:sugar/nucleoside kinase (ribokinase family)